MLTNEEQNLSSKEIQQSFFEMLGDRDWNRYSAGDRIYLRNNIRYALFGPPEIEQDFENDAKVSQNPDEINRQNIINNLFSQIIKHGASSTSGDILIAIIFVICEFNDGTCTPVPVFRVKKSITSPNEGCQIFIDDNSRVYSSWKNYLIKNQLPKCQMVVPKDGKYSGKISETTGQIEVQLEFLSSPACSTRSVARNITDKLNTVVAIGSGVTVATATAIAAVTTAPVVLTAAGSAGLFYGSVSGAYTAIRSLQTLVDRKQHDQDIGLKNYESRGCWLGIAGGAASIFAGGATKLLSRSVQSGVQVKTAARTAYSIIHAINAANGRYYQNQPSEDRDVSTLEILSFAGSALFFGHMAISIKIVKEIIRAKTQPYVLDELEKKLQIKGLRKVCDKVIDDLEHNKDYVEIVRDIIEITNADEFIARMIIDQKNKFFKSS